MATLDDRLLGEKLHYYCSSSESDSEDDSKDYDHKEGDDSTQVNSSTIREPDCRQWEGSSVNTGPKGVISDWQRFKQQEIQKREEQEKEKLLLIKKLALTCSSELDEEKNEEKEESLQDFLEDTFLKEYMQRRMKEMMDLSARKQSVFGELLTLQNGQEFLDAIDKEPKSTTVIIHIFKNNNRGCEAMNGCLRCLASEYPQVKFCSIEASSAGMSKHFEESGVPALLAYKGSTMIGNFVRLTDEFGDDFFAVDVENFLIEHGLLPDQKLVPPIIQSSSCCQDEDSDFDVE